MAGYGLRARRQGVRLPVAASPHVQMVQPRTARPIRVDDATKRLIWRRSHLRVYSVIIVSPTPGMVTPILTPQASVDPNSDDGNVVDVQVQTATDSTFTTNVTTQTLTNVSVASVATFSLGPFADKTDVYIRARGGRSGSYGMWTGTVAFRTYTNAGNATESVYVNVGPLFLPQDGVESVYANVGAPLVVRENATESVYVGNVDTTQPEPYLWAIYQTSGRPGDGFTLFGGGMGATQVTYTGQVEIEIDGAWVALSVLRWALIAPSAEYGTAGQVIEPYVANIDPEHVEIDVVIPNGAFPPGHKVRVRTVKP